MYQTLYRKYRPSTFDEVVGQDIIIRTIKNEIKNNKLNHAYIFSGPRGTGKTSTAKIIAKKFLKYTIFIVYTGMKKPPSRNRTAALP